MATQTVELETFHSLDSTAQNLTSSTIGSTGHSLRSAPPSSIITADSSQENEVDTPKLSTSRAWIVIVQLCGIQFISSLSNGLLTVGLPAIASGLAIPDNLLVWPNSAFYLTTGSCLLIAGAVADVIGPRRVNIPGSLLLSIFICASGLSKEGIDLIMFRALQGIASAMVVPSSLSIISTNVEDGRPRNIGFAFIFLSQPLGFAIGLVLGGVLSDTVGWRVGFYIGGAVGVVCTFVGFWTVPKDPQVGSVQSVLKRLTQDIDWVGALVASTSLAAFSYVLATLSADLSKIKDATSIGLLVLSLTLMPFFPFWMMWQEKHGRPALIPNSIWKNISFTSVCCMILFSNAVVNCMELFTSLFFQKVQQLSATQASIRILPAVVVGVMLNFLSGIFVNKAPVRIVVTASSILCALAPLLMAIIDPAWPYWDCAFVVQALVPLSVDILSTVGTIVVSSAFPSKTQALAGAVFNTFSQLGTSIGLCTMQVISTSVTAKSSIEDKASPAAVMEGYRATFWTMFAFMLATVAISFVGLQKIGKVGVKRD